MNARQVQYDELSFAVELWSHDDQRVDSLLAQARSVHYARAAYVVAAKEYAGRIVTLLPGHTRDRALRPHG